ncbi:sensor domain-containing protein [Mycobacteroides chelonae]|uniref:sensor domain-containing protein n=1 Tax=Mycobacteroides chelonae TaxID=1774 RepID=UPI0008A99F65|nr:sensor domain-containing protein [Mycobacteroides chelonae]OHU32302.1 sensor domain-containing protein [Mycobacteroides chelonae]OHU65219.1 sensor domain-containing protein [Mycobacteroides chelonae]
MTTTKNTAGGAMTGTTARAVLCATAIAALALSGCSGQREAAGTSTATTTTASRSVNAPAPAPVSSGPAGLTGWPGQDKITEEAMVAALFTNEEISKVFDAEVAKTNKREKPFTATESDDASCNVTQGLTVESVGKEYETFRGTEMLLGDAESPDAQVYQSIAAYKDKDSAQAQFSTAADEITECDGKSYNFTDPGGRKVPVTVSVSLSNDKKVNWALTYGPSKYRCFVSYNGVANLIVQTQVCARSNSKQLVQKMADRIVDKLQLS